jgi:hypothetical protein
MSSQPKQQHNYYYERSPSPSSQRQPTKYQIPSKDTYQYRNCSHPIEEICGVTNNMELLPPDFKYAMLSFICQAGLNGPSVYSEYPAPPNDATTEQINGRGGYFLKKTTEAANIYLIWYDRKRKMYMFWGAIEKAVRDAMNRLRGRITKIMLFENTSSSRSSNNTTTTTTSRQNSMTTAPGYSSRNIAESPPPRNIAESPPPPPPCCSRDQCHNKFK